MKKKVSVLLVANDANTNDQDDGDFESNSVDFSFLDDDYEISLEYLTIQNHKSIIDGIDSEGYAGECVVQYLHDNKRIYSGCSPRNYKWKKSDIRKFDVSSPGSVLIEQGDDVSGLTEKDFSHMSYPFIVKPDYNGGSMGITDKSRVYGIDDLKTQLELSLKTYPSVIVEEFITGREFTALVCENPSDRQNPLVLEPMECVFHGSETFKHYNLKWIDWQTIRYEVIADKTLEERIMNFTRDLFITMDIDGYVRFDLRMNGENILYVNDVNPYCGLYFPPDLYGSADLIIVNSKKTDHRKFTEHLFDCALRRQATGVLSR